MFAIRPTISSLWSLLELFNTAREMESTYSSATDRDGEEI